MVIGVVTLAATAMLTALIAALIMSSPFRRDMLRGRGETNVGNLVSAKGVTIVLLAVVLSGVILVGLSRIERAEVRGSASTYLQALSEAESAQMQALVEKRMQLRKQVDRFMQERWYPTFLRNYAELTGVAKELDERTEATRTTILGDYALAAIQEATRTRDQLLEPIEKAFDGQAEALRQDYRRRREAAVAGKPLADTTEALTRSRLHTEDVARAVSRLEELGVQRDSIEALLGSLQ